MDDLLIQPDGYASRVTPNNGKHYELGELQKVVGGYIELVPIPGSSELLAIVNEEGLLAKLTPNQRASVFIKQVVVGTVMIVNKSHLGEDENEEEGEEGLT